MFKDKVLLITGGTGSFGNAVLKRFLNMDVGEIRIFSRDEKKQDDMRKKFNHPKLKFYIGDVRDMQSVMNVCRGVDFIFHAAALKQVPSCEFYPLEAVKTNILGTENVLEAAIQCDVSRVICLSTDKAVYPINAMGISKAMMEKIMVAKSRGSVIPLFVSQVRNKLPITVTDPNMTRFMMTLDSAVDLVIFAFEHGHNGDIFVQKAPASTVADTAQSVVELLNSPDHEIKIIGTRQGEKVSEALLSREEVMCAVDLGDYFRIPSDIREHNYSKYYEHGDMHVSEFEDYNSHNTNRLNLLETKQLISGLACLQDRRRATNLK